jgi:hypothetical protein
VLLAAGMVVVIAAAVVVVVLVANPSMITAGPWTPETGWGS